GGLDLAAARRRAGDERAEQARGRVRDLLDGAIERLGVRLRGLRGAADLAHVLKRRPVYLLGARRGLEVVESLDVATHVGKRTEPPRSARGRGRKRGGKKRGGEAWERLTHPVMQGKLQAIKGLLGMGSPGEQSARLRASPGG